MPRALISLVELRRVVDFLVGFFFFNLLLEQNVISKLFKCWTVVLF